MRKTYKNPIGFSAYNSKLIHRLGLKCWNLLKYNETRCFTTQPKLPPDQTNLRLASFLLWGAQLIQRLVHCNLPVCTFQWRLNDSSCRQICWFQTWHFGHLGHWCFYATAIAHWMQQLGPLGSRLTMDFCGICWHVHSGTDPVSSKRPILQDIWQDRKKNRPLKWLPQLWVTMTCSLRNTILVVTWNCIGTFFIAYERYDHPADHISRLVLFWGVLPSLHHVQLDLVKLCKTAENTSNSCLAMTVPPFSGPISDHPKLVYLVSAQATWNCRAVESIAYLHYRPTKKLRQRFAIEGNQGKCTCKYHPQNALCPHQAAKAAAVLLFIGRLLQKIRKGSAIPQ